MVDKEAILDHPHIDLEIHTEAMDILVTEISLLMDGVLWTNKTEPVNILEIVLRTHVTTPEPMEILVMDHTLL